MPAQPQNRLSVAACLPRQPLTDVETMEFSETAPILHGVTTKHGVANWAPMIAPRRSTNGAT
jgi:hypothetical protein